jgi:hypothetical protein
VKRIVASSFLIDRQSPDTATRSQRVHSAWLEKGPYIRGRKPITLRIEGKSPSFEALCRQYSGDIPHKVILSELENTGRVVVDDQRMHVAIAAKRSRNPQLGVSERALSFAAVFIEQALSDEAVIVRRRQRIQVASSTPMAYAEKAIAGRVNDLLDQAPHLFPKGRGRDRAALQIFALVSTGKKGKKG